MSIHHQTRNDRRFSYNATILIDNYPHGVHYIARMVNFSKSGACLHTDAAFPVGQKLILAIEDSPYPECPGVYVAVVKWCRKAPDMDSNAGYEIGIRYLSTRPEDLDLVRFNEATAVQIGRVDRHRARGPATRHIDAAGGGRGKVLSFERHSRHAVRAEGRRHHRKSVVIPTHYTTASGIHWGIIRNINRSGIYIEKYLKNSDSQRLGESITVMLPSKITHRTIKIVGEIVWMDRDGCGVKFKSRANPRHQAQY